MKRILLAGGAAIALAFAVAAPAAAQETTSTEIPTCASAVAETDGSDTLDGADDKKDGRADWPEHQTSGQPDDDGSIDPEGAPDLPDGAADRNDGYLDFRDRTGDPDGNGDDEQDTGSEHDGYLDFREHANGTNDGDPDGAGPDSDDDREGSLDAPDGAADLPELKDGSDTPEKDGSDTIESDGSDIYEDGECETSTSPTSESATHAGSTTASPTTGTEVLVTVGADKDCTELTQAQARQLLAENPSDPHRLDADHDGNPCENSTVIATASDTDELAYTGTPDVGWLVLGGSLLLIGGSAALLLARRRHQS